MRGRAGLIVVTALVLGCIAALAGPVAATPTTTDPSVLQIRPVLALLPASQVSTQPADATPEALAAVSSCDAGRVAALAKVPATPAKQVVPGACVVGTLLGGVDPEYLYLGAANLTAADAKRAHSAFISGVGSVVEFTLKREGLRKFNQLAAASFDQESPLNEVAIVVKGRVLSNPSFQSNHFTGAVQIAGNFTRKEAAKLAKAIDRAAR